ncbi:amidohydrolase family protein [Algoriphagus confluentis]|uniref:Amidohydrolase family protein n=1 Tax=Algoriphagus confluentis TaxID=1697556 RepID=A0ABQ6PKD1_9BACT|nr:amidohydrolase family protein [Algoriphagus confluentis]
MKKSFLKAGLLGLLVAGFFIQSANAQSDPTGKRRVTGTYAITNATLFPSPGQPGTKSTVLFKDGIILGVGSGISIPAGTQVIPGDSLFIYPGFIDGAGSMGITKPKDPEKPKDFVSSAPPDELAGITPWRTAVDQFDPASSEVDDWRKAGFTISHLIPDGGMIPGKSAILVLGDGKSTNLIRANTAMAANFRGSRGMYPATASGVMAKFRDVYQNSTLALEHESLFASNAGVTRPKVTPTQSGMAPVIQKQIPVIFEAPKELEIRRAMALQKELGFNLILTGLENYEHLIPVLKSSGIPVLVQLSLPDDKAIKAQKEDGVTDATQAQYARVKEAYEAVLKQAAKLEAAGIPFAFSTSGAKSGDALKNLRTMIENGLSEKAALAALTTNAASILGISRIAGSVEKGKLANFIVSTDSIFNEDAQIKHVVADGYIFDYEVKKKTSNGNGTTKPGEGISIAGVWEYQTESPAGSTGGELEFTQEGAGYQGSITYDDPSGSGKAKAPVKNISVNGNQITFEFDVNAGGTDITVTVSGEINGTTMDGTMSIAQFGSFPLTAKLASPSL